MYKKSLAEYLDETVSGNPSSLYLIDSPSDQSFLLLYSRKIILTLMQRRTRRRLPQERSAAPADIQELTRVLDVASTAVPGPVWTYTKQREGVGSVAEHTLVASQRSGLLTIITTVRRAHVIHAHFRRGMCSAKRTDMNGCDNIE